MDSNTKETELKMPKQHNKKETKSKVKASPSPESDTESQGTDQGVQVNKTDANFIDSGAKEKEFKAPKQVKKKEVRSKVKANHVPESDTDSQGTDQGV